MHSNSVRQPEAMELLVRPLHRLAEPLFRAYSESAAWDLSALAVSEGGHLIHITIPPNRTTLIRTGLSLLAPRGHAILICSRSGLASQSIFVANAPGVVDPDYTGEIKVLLFNGGREPYYVRNGDRIAQALIVPFASCQTRKVEEFPSTERGDKGFGSTGN